MIEHFLKKTDEFSQYGSLLDAEGDADYIGTWRKNVDYFRLDGSTPSDVRTEYTNRFNHPSNQRYHLTRVFVFENCFLLFHLICFEYFNVLTRTQSLFQPYNASN